MNKPTLPGFTAVAALSKSSGSYRSQATHAAASRYPIAAQAREIDCMEWCHRWGDPGEEEDCELFCWELPE